MSALAESRPCQYCGRNFKGMSGLTQHIKRCPRYNKDDCCTFCRGQVINLVQHVERCKDNPANHDRICKFCGETRVQMQLHLTKCRSNPDNQQNPSVGRAIFSRPVSTFNSAPRINPNNSVPPINTNNLAPPINTNNLAPLVEGSTCDLANILAILAKRLKYDNIDDLLQDHDLLCSVCFEITDNKTNCNHPVCRNCLKTIKKSCPICMADLNTSLLKLTLSP